MSELGSPVRGASKVRHQGKSAGWGCVLALLLLASGCQNKGPELLAWAKKRDVPAGESRELRLPPELEGESENHHATVARLDARRVCVLVKTDIGFKDNFEGILFCSAPLKKGELIERAQEGSRSYVSLEASAELEELYVRKTIDARTFEVYLDLN